MLSHMLAEISFTGGGVSRNYINEFFGEEFWSSALVQIDSPTSSKVIQESLEFSGEISALPTRKEGAPDTYLPTSTGS